MSELEKFIEERSNNYPIPEGPVEQVTLLAKELVLGVHKGFWVATLYIIQSNTIGGEFVPIEKELRQYLQHRWGDIHIGQWKRLLRGHGYLDDIISTNGKPFTRLSRQAFALLSEAPLYNVFVSYTHRESSAFALLLVNKLQHYGIEPFCDMSLIPGDDWHPELEKQIAKCEYFVVLVGKETRKSCATLKEIKWALENDKIVIPIWHNGFRIERDEWTDIDEVIVNAIERKHAVIVDKESAAGYNAAITELLTNRFGITP
ncbi:MAG: TIR domain-containing protein [Chloroflexi bacterium]|nr:TIR domain-containing protein [Chloroflexota bacterium]